MDIEGAQGKGIEKGPGKYLPIGHDNRTLGTVGGDTFDNILSLEPFRLIDGNIERLSQNFDWRRFGLLPSPTGAVRLGDHQGNFTPGINELLKTRHRKVRCPHEDYASHSGLYASASLCCFFHFRLKMSREIAPILSMKSLPSR